MFTKERRAGILKMLENNQEVLVTTLAHEFDTSEVTIRKDLTELQRRNLLIRTRGGAIRVPNTRNDIDTSVDKKRLFNFKEKRAIGRLAATLIEDGDTIMIDSGSTTLEIAKNLDRFHDLTIITSAINIAMELLRYDRFNIIMLGGHLRKTSHSVVGPMVETTLRILYCDKLFIGIDSFTPEGISTPNIEEANTNQTMISRARQTIAVCDSSKFGKRSLAHIASLNEISTVVTDSGLNAETQRMLVEHGVKVMIAKPSEL